VRRVSIAGIWTPKTYDWLAKYYDRLSILFSPTIGHQELSKEMNPGRILDVGCGTETLLARADKNGMTCFGLDTSSGMLNQARSKLRNANFIQGSFYNLPYANQCFPYVVESNALGGAQINVKQALFEMLRVCSTGGERRLADYTKPTKETWKQRLLIKIGTIFGDYPIDYTAIFKEFGYKTRTKILEGSGMYQSPHAPTKPSLTPRRSTRGATKSKGNN